MEHLIHDPLCLVALFSPLSFSLCVRSALVHALLGTHPHTLLQHALVNQLWTPAFSLEMETTVELLHDLVAFR